MTGQAFTAAVALALSAVLAGCGQGADTGATSNPNAPGSPGTGNAAEVSTPTRAAGQGDSGAPGPSGVKGSAPHPGSSGGDTVSGITGRGTDEAGGRSQTAQPGLGTTGGLGGQAGAAATMGAGQPTSGSADAGQTTVPDGSPNRTTSGAVGRR